MSESEIQKLETEAKNWALELCRPSKYQRHQVQFEEGMYPAANILPYIHSMLNHLGDHLRAAATMNVPLRKFSTQALEKKNHLQSNLYFQKTQKNGN